MKNVSRKSRPEKKLVVKVPGDVKRISTLDLIKKAVLEYLERKNRLKRSVVSKEGFMPDFEIMQDISFIAIVVEGEVQDVMRAQPRLTSILMAQPTFVRFNPEEVKVRPGDTYDGSNFVQKNMHLNPQAFELLKDEQNED
jgi:hypothetical protein